MTGFVGERFGVTLRGHDGEPLGELVQLALRRNPKRAHLLVSTVLGKHVPVDPRSVHETGLRLGRAVAGRVDEPPALVIGYAETATGLGHCVAEALGADYLHSTRRAIDGLAPAGSFVEQHSHATGHLLLPEDPALLSRSGVVVLVDDEFSTGATALNTIAELQRLCPRARYVIAALVDLRTPIDRERTLDTAARLGTSVEVVSLASGAVSWPDGFAAQAAEFVGAQMDVPQRVARADVIEVPARWTARESGRHGFTPDDQVAARAAAAAQAGAVMPTGPAVLVLGAEELMYAPLLIAVELAGRDGLDVSFSSSTRSPVLAVDEPGYPIRTMLRFAAHDGTGTRYAYNIATGFDDIVVVLDTDEPDLIAVLRTACDRLHVVRLPSSRPAPPALRGPAFGSYAADEVAWLLTDLSDVALEAPIEEREEAVQSGGAHYAESLPIEYQPSAEYQALFAAALDETAERIAHAVGVVTELVLDARGPGAVLVSLARAGTPIGILMRRWAQREHNLDLPHYAVSIVRGRGIDKVALRHLAAHHDPAQVMFVDGWTGKGAIARELAAAVREADPRFSPQLAVLADTGSCVSLYGTRADFLIPSACLNSTVSGLVSRTVRNDRVIAPGRFDGAKFYKELAFADVSGLFLDAISARFAAVADEVARDWPKLRDSDRTPTWSGWAAVEQISAKYGINNVNLVKPGVGETTRVLLRRVPWRVLVHPDAGAELRHVLLLATQRGVPVEEVPDLPYSCVGLIHPAYTRGATGADGRVAR
ncbi:MAG TPA: phosphoribosyltransferase [Jatrophihabitantaceae bacterium]|nr:phosphoribosyltransferase [Jatrophihabitantaceae bacterium]